MSPTPKHNATLDDLNSGDPDRERRALVQLTEELIEYARRRLRVQRDQVNTQPESVVQSVLRRELEGGLAYENDDHMHGRLRIAIARKIADRKKEGGSVRTVHDPGDGSLDRAAREARGVGTEVVELERADRADSQREDARDRLLEGLQPADRDLVRHLIFKGLTSQATAAALDSTPEAIRKRLQRLRPALRGRLLEPLRRALSPEDWTVLSGCLIDRQKPQILADMLGWSVEELAARFAELFDEKVGPQLGPDAIEYLTRLLGAAKSTA